MKGRQVSAVTTTLIEEKLPRLQVIHELYLAIMERERLLYEYYATTDSKRILPQLTLIDQRFSTYFRQIELAYPNSTDIEKIRYGDVMVRNLTQQLDHNFQQSQVNWDQVRQQLIALSETGRKILPALEALVAQINTEAFQGGENTRHSTKLTTQLVISFSIFVIIIAAFFGYYVNRYITETISRRLAIFAERSTNPMILQQHNHSHRIESLLPDNFQVRLIKLQKSNGNYSQWVSQISDNVTSSTGFKTGDLLMQPLVSSFAAFCQGYCSLDLENKLYHLDSNKFSLLLDHLPEHDFATELHQTMAKAVFIEDKEFHLSLSIGISHYPTHSLKIEQDFRQLKTWQSLKTLDEILSTILSNT